MGDVGELLVDDHAEEDVQSYPGPACGAHADADGADVRDAELVEAHEADEQPRRDRRGWRGRRGWDNRVDRGGWRDRRVDVEVRTHLRERGGRRGERFRYRGR